MRLDKFLAEAGIGTRKTIRAYIQNGMVKVNGQVIVKPAVEIEEKTDIIMYLDKVVKYAGKVYYMFNKPQGCITARRDESQKTVFDYFKNENMNGVFHVGRLDKDTEGLLLLTNDGEFEHGLMCPNKHVDKKYYFCALGSLEDSDINKLKNGVLIGQGKILTKPAKIKVEKIGTCQDFQQYIGNEKISEKDFKVYKQPMVSGYLTIKEGRKHQVKRMLKAVGCFVFYLKRVSIGNVFLDEALKKGEYRFLTDSELQMLSGL
ncbi:pseudouridine synthase [Haloimpatiens sp. FM7315]|uniref:pseudouridine synthase n=1 Tax=Haloimpatiens sp. FM7315 TaxID=3298609 RepID=UPI0035A33B04